MHQPPPHAAQAPSGSAHGMLTSSRQRCWMSDRLGSPGCTSGDNFSLPPGCECHFPMGHKILPFLSDLPNFQWKHPSMKRCSGSPNDTPRSYLAWGRRGQQGRPKSWQVILQMHQENNKKTFLKHFLLGVWFAANSLMHHWV